MTDLRPLADVPFAALGRRWVAWIAAEVEDGCRDVVVYELIGAKALPRYAFVGVLGARFVAVGRWPRAIREVATALAARLDGAEFCVGGEE